MQIVAYIVLSYLVIQAIALVAIALWSECRQPSRTERHTLSSPFSTELN